MSPHRRLLASLMALVAAVAAGMGILFYALSAMTAFLVEGELTSIIRRRKMDKQISKLRSHTIVCGVGTTGIHVLQELAAVGEPMVAIEASETNLDRALQHLGLLCLHGDATDETMLRRAGIEHARGVVTVLAIREADGTTTYYPDPATRLREHARLIVLADRPRLERLRQLVAPGT